MSKIDRIVRRISPSKKKSAQPPVTDYMLKKVVDENGGRSIGNPAPVFLHVADKAISEADIAKEMQYHPSNIPAKSRADAARALVVRELLNREIDRLGLLDQVDNHGKETYLASGSSE